MSKINEQILLILAILCIFIIIPCSFAVNADDNSTLTDGTDVADENSIYVSVNGNDTAGEGTEANPYQSISKAVENYDSSKNSNIFVKNGTYTFDGRVTINKEVTIIGESNTGVIFDGAKSSSIFEITSNNVKLNGLTFINGYCEDKWGSDGGAAILANSNNFVVDNCIFENNSGGAVTADGDNVVITNSIFKNNTVNAWGNSGASIRSSGLNITNCQFLYNYAAYGGSAIFSSNSHKRIYIKNSTFVGNNASNEASVIYMYNMYSPITMSDNKFINNIASNDANIISIDANTFYGTPNLYLSGNTFENNIPNNEISTNMNIIYIDANTRISGIDIATMDVGTDESFIVTLTDIDGVGISGKTVTITFTDYLKRVNSYTAVTNSEGKAIISLINQTAGTYIVLSSFAGDSEWDAVNTTNSVKIKSEHSYNIVFNETIVKVNAGDSHKVLATVCNEYIIPVLLFTNYDVTWTTLSGGTRITTNGAISGSTFVVDVIDFDLSTSSSYYYINFTARADSTEVTAKGTLIVDTSIPLPPVSRDLDVIYVAKDGSDEYGDGTEDNPLATVQTALYVNEIYGGNRIVYVKEGTYDISNYEVYANVTVIGEKSKTIFKQTQGDDGMLYLDNGATVKFVNVSFTGGYEAEYTIYGAVIVIRYAGSVAYFDGCEFYDNNGSSDGIIYVAHNSVAYFNDCKFENNYAWTFNAAGVIEVYSAYLSVTNCYFANNTASEGAGIFVGGDAYAWIENTTFYQNKALNDSYAVSGGGAIYVNNWNTYITNCSFIENYADVNGGAIYILIGKVEIDRCYFENNHVGSSGSGKGSAIASDSGYTVLLYVDHSVFLTDDYSRMVAIVNDLAEENEIILNYNYWGNSGQATPKNYVVLQASASSNDIRKGDAVEITVEFKDNSGNPLTKNVHDLTLDLIAQLGTVDVSSITISNNTAKFTYFATNVGSENILFRHGQTLYTMKFNVNESEVAKEDFNANISVNTDRTKIIVEVPTDIANNITIKIDDETYTVNSTNGVATLDLDVLPGNHVARVMYNGDENYNAFISNEFNFTVDKYEADLGIEIANAVAGEEILVNITANNKFSGNVIVTINNKNYTVRVNNGKGSTTINSLLSGQYTAIATFEGNNYFESDSANTDFNISESTITVIYVSSTGKDSNDGSESSPYATISKALDRNKRLGGGKTIIVSEGNYILNRYSIINDVTIIGIGNVVISQNANTNHIYIGGNVKVNLVGLTFINGTGIQSGSIETGSSDAGNIGKVLNITNCNFINNKGLVGTISSYANTIISKSCFINNTATGKDGYNQAIISIQDCTLDLKNSIFLNNNYENNIIVSRVSGQVNDNFWGTNNKPADVDKTLELASWVCIVPSIDEDIRTKTNYDLSVKFQKTADGVNFYDVDVVPNLTVDLEAINGLINPTSVVISENNAVANYYIDQKGSDTINVNLYGNTISSLEFNVDVLEADKIYVAVNGSDSNIGTKNSPLATIAQALVQNKANGGNKTIIILSGEYKEHNLIVDTIVTILGENATIDGENSDIFTISADAEIANIVFTNSNIAIKQLSGNLYIYETEFTNNANGIISDSVLKAENLTFSSNSIALEANGIALIENCEFVQNTEIAVKVTDDALIGNSTFTDNVVAINAVNSQADILNNVFKNNDLAISAENSDALIMNNEFSGELIKLNQSCADLVANTNVTIKLINSNVTNVIVKFMNSQTIIVNNGTIELNATVTDDMGNVIDGGKITFTSNGENIGVENVNNGVATLQHFFTKGDYTISGSFDSDADAILENGLVRVDVDYYWFIGEVGYETLEDAIAAAEIGDVIKGIPGVYNVGKLQIGHRYFANEPWEIIKSITITSINDNPVTLKGRGIQMFFVDIGSELTLKNLIIRDAGNTGDDGGAIETLYNTNLAIINCTFINNTGGDGGAVYAFGTTILEIRDTVFDSNYGLLAGALQVVAYGTQDITIKNVTFSNNKAHYAGAFYNGGATIEITGSKFINNTASIGGALYTNSGSITVTDSEFIGNKAVNNDDVTTTSMGGAFHNMLADATFRNVKFIDNHADGLGGAMELENGYYGTITWTILDNCTFINNTARDGGAIYAGETYDPYVRITSSSFDSNTAENNGAAIYDNCAHITIDSTKFINNAAGSLDIIHVIGELFESQIYPGELTITKSEFKNNDADYIIFTNGYGVLKVSDSKLDTQKMFVFNRGDSTIKNTNVTNSADKVIENLGNLTLSGNNFDTPILNKKEIKSVTYIVVLDNQTQYAAINENYLLTAVVVDDNGNIIEGGNLVFLVSGEQISAAYENNRFIANYTVTEGTKTIDALYDDDGLTQLKVKTGVLVAKISPELSCEVPEAKVGSDAVITASVNLQASGNITFTINNRTYHVTIKNGVSELSISGLAAGQYPVEISYAGDDNFAPAKQSLTLVVSKVSDYRINVDVSKAGVGEDVTITVILPKDANGQAIVIVDEDEYPAIIYNGQTSVVVSNLGVGTHNLFINYYGNDKYSNSTFETTFKVAKIDSNITITAPNIYLGDVAVIIVNTPFDAIGDVVITVDSNDYYATVSNGQASVEIPDLDLGTHTVEATYYGDALYLSSSSNAIFNVTEYNPVNIDIEVPNIVNAGKDANLGINLPSDAKGTITVKVDGNVYAVADVVDGIANIDLKNLTAGAHIVEVEYSGDGKYPANSTTTAIVVTKDPISKVETVIEAVSQFSRVAVDYSAGEQGEMFYITLKDAKGNILANKNVQFIINGQINDVFTDNQGRAGIKVNIAKAGTYYYVISFKGDSEYEASSNVIVKLTVTKKKTSISAKKKTFKARTKTKKITVTLKTSKNAYDKKTYLKAGKKLTLKVNGKIYTAKINKKGKATFKITKLTRRGKYTAVIKFKGDNTYKSSTKKVKIVVK